MSPRFSKLYHRLQADHTSSKVDPSQFNISDILKWAQFVELDSGRRGLVIAKGMKMGDEARLNANTAFMDFALSL